MIFLVTSHRRIVEESQGRTALNGFVSSDVADKSPRRSPPRPVSRPSSGLQRNNACSASSCSRPTPAPAGRGHPTGATEGNEAFRA